MSDPGFSFPPPLRDVQAMLAGTAGLLLSYHLDTPSGPTIICCAGALYAASLLLANGFNLPLSKPRPTP